MSAMRDMLALRYWIDNENKALLETALSNKRQLPREKTIILQELREEGKYPNELVKTELNK